MAGAQRATTLRHIQRLFSEGSFTGLSDTQLLSRFALRRDEAAFAALVVWHGPMVLTARRDCSSTGEIPLADCYVLPGRSDTRTGRRSTAVRRGDLEAAIGESPRASRSAPGSLRLGTGRLDVGRLAGERSGRNRAFGV
jgi:hypothetical protein